MFSRLKEFFLGQQSRSERIDLSQYPPADIITRDVCIIGSVRSFRHITPEVRILGSHSPFQLRASTEAIADGFYRKLNALQGQRRTYYIGAAYESHNSPQIWELTVQLLEKEVLPSLSM